MYGRPTQVPRTIFENTRTHTHTHKYTHTCSGRFVSSLVGVFLLLVKGRFLRTRDWNCGELVFFFNKHLVFVWILDRVVLFVFEL